MKNIIKSIALFAMVALMLATVGCGEKKERILYQKANLDKYVTIGEHKNLKVDTSSKEYKEYYEYEIQNDIQLNALFETLKEGKVEKGDIANIDYTGKKDGVAFEGGSAKGHDLEIGSGSFIPGFEDGLIGAAIGSTIDLNLTFPKDYNSKELAGAAVVFTVKVNSVKREMKSADYYDDLKFKSEQEYLDDVSMRAAKDLLLGNFLDKSKAKKYPKYDVKVIRPILMKQIEDMYKQQYGVTIEQFLSYSGQTEEQFEEMVDEKQLYPLMEQQMAMYCLMDNNSLEVTKKDVDAAINEIISYKAFKGVKPSELKNNYGEYYFEAMAVEKIVKDYLYKNAEIK